MREKKERFRFFFFVHKSEKSSPLKTLTYWRACFSIANSRFVSLLTQRGGNGFVGKNHRALLLSRQREGEEEEEEGRMTGGDRKKNFVEEEEEETKNAATVTVEERGGRNPQDKSHLAFHDERFQCRKCARNASCFRVHKATQRIITIGKKKSLKKVQSPGKKPRLKGQKAKREAGAKGRRSGYGEDDDYQGRAAASATGRRQRTTTTSTSTRKEVAIEYAYDDPRYELKKLKDSGHRPTMKTYTAVVAALGKQNKAKEAEEIFNQEAKVEFDCDAAIFNAVAHGYCENDQPDEAMRFVDSWMEEIESCDRPDMKGTKDKIAKPNRATHPEIINAYARNGEYRKVYRTLRIMEEKHLVVPSERTYNAFIKGCIENNDPDEAETVIERWNNEKYDLEKMASKLVTKPQAASYGMVIDYHCNNGNVGKGRKLLEKMRWANVSPSLPIFNMLLKGYLKSGNPRAAEVIFRELQGGGSWDMEKMRVKPDVQTYTMFLEYWANSGDTENAERFLTAMRKDKNKIRIDSFVIASVAKAYARACDPEMAEERCKSLIEEYKIKPHVVPLTTVVAAYCTSGDTREAERVVREMTENYNVNPNERTFSHVIWAHGQREDVASIRRVASWMVDLGFRIDCGDTKKALVRALQECSLGRNAVENMIQDVANQDAISKRRAENGNQRFYERINDDDAQAAKPSDAISTSRPLRQLQRRSFAVGRAGRAAAADGTTPRAFRYTTTTTPRFNTAVARGGMLRSF